MDTAKLAYKLQVLFEKKVTGVYRNSYKGEFGKVQVEVLDFLYEQKEGRVQTIADTLLIPKQHASKIILRLVELNLVESKTDTADKRSTLFYLSEKGTKLVEEHIKASNEHFYSLLNHLSKAQEEQFVQSMETLTQLLEKM